MRTLSGGGGDRAVNLIMDPREERQVAEPYNTWGQYRLDVVTEFQASVQKFSNVPVGAQNDYAPQATAQLTK
jgi:hypothetical protein